MSELTVLIIRACYIGLFTGIVIAIPMGPAGIESVRWTILGGLKKGLLVAAGSLLADAFDVMLINFGLLSLIQTNRLLEVFFWMLSGVVIFVIGFRAIKNTKNPEVHQAQAESPDNPSMQRPFLTGFLINVTNPMTHFFWLTLSSTVICVWQSAGELPYFLFTVFLLTGMFIGLFLINLLVSRGKRIRTPKLSGRVTLLLSYGIAAFGVGFFVYGLIRLYISYR